MVDFLFFCATLTTAEGDIPLLFKQERKHPAPVQRSRGDLSRTYSVLDRAIPGGWVPMSAMKYGVSSCFPTTPPFIGVPTSTPQFCCRRQVN